MINFVKKNIIALWVIIAIFILGTYYVSIATYNIPIMDYWRYLNEIGDKIFNNQLELSDLWTTSADIHRNPFMYLCMILNIKYFGWNTQIEIFLGQFVLLITTVIMYIFYNKIFENKINSRIKQLLFIPIVMCIFNINQWEIWILEFSFTFMLRIQLFLIVFILVDTYLREVVKNKKLLFPINILILATIIMIAQGYFVAFAISIVLTILFKYLISFKLERNKYIGYYLSMVFVIFIACAIYLWGIELPEGSGGFLQTASTLIFDGTIIKGIIILLGASVLWSASEVSILHVIFGIAILLLLIISLLIYIRKKIYKITYLPIMLIMYSFINMGTIIYSRADIFGVSYLISSRYVCETTLCLIGGILIFLINYYESTERQKPIALILTTFMLVLIVITMAISIVLEFKTAPYRKEYFKKAEIILKNIKNFSDEDLQIFQATSPDMVKHGEVIMKRYSLGAFKTDLQEYKKLFVGDTANKIGIFDDGWAENEFEFIIKTGDKGKVVISGYYPGEITGKEMISLTVDGVLTEYTIRNSVFNIELNAEKNSPIEVKGICNFSSELQPPDIRQLSFIISEIKGL